MNKKEKIIQNIINNIEMQCAENEAFGEDLHNVSWDYEDGVLISTADAETLIKEFKDCLSLLQEIAMRSQIAFPLNSKQNEWFEHGLNSDFMKRLYNKLEILSTKAYEDE